MAKRKDATRVIVDDPFHMIVPYIMPKRTEAEVSTFETFDVTNLMKYIEEKNKKKGNNIKLFHCICYAVAKTIYHRPLLNRFIAGKYFWQRNDISLSFVAKQKFNDEAQEVLMFLYAKPEMTINEISKTILGDVENARKNGSNDLDNTMEFFGKMPRFVISFVVWLLKKLDFYGLMPQSLAKGDPNFSTVLLSNLGSIGAGAPYHHLSEYGTNSLMATIGTLKEEKNKSTLSITITLDERIADGFYFAKSLKYIDYCFKHPEIMDKPLSEPFPDILDTKENKKTKSKKVTKKKETNKTVKKTK